MIDFIHITRLDALFRKAHAHVPTPRLVDRKRSRDHSTYNLKTCQFAWKTFHYFLVDFRDIVPSRYKHERGDNNRRILIDVG
jgi:hypothetical protein